MTIWLSHDDKARLVDMAQRWHRSPSEMIQEALAQFDPVGSRVTDTETDTEQLRILIRDELTDSPFVTAMVTDVITATLPVLVRRIVEEMALEALGVPVTDTSSDVTVTETHREALTERKRGRRSILRQSILDLLHTHPEGLNALEMKVHLDTDRRIGDTLSGMVRDKVITKRKSGTTVRYVLPPL
jgi:hypothetical protein